LVTFWRKAGADADAGIRVALGIDDDEFTPA
jgi:hypothetical protein